MKFILMLLSVYRISYMIVNEIGPLGIFEKIRSFIANKSYDNPNSDYYYWYNVKSETWKNIDEGLNCEYCVSVWVSGIIWLLSKTKLHWLINIFGLAGAWMLLQELLERKDNDS